MRNLKKLLLLLLVLSTTNRFAIAQERQDTIVFANGLREAVILKLNADDYIEFTYPGEDLTNRCSKSQVSQIILKNGRVIETTRESAESTIKRNDQSTQFGKSITAHDIARMEALKWGRQGAWGPLKNPKSIALSVEFSPYVANRIVGDLKTFAEQCAAKAISKADLPPIYHVYDGNDADAYAKILIIEADDDGEMYGILDFYAKSDLNNPVFSSYLNGNGTNGSSFDARLLGGVSNAAFIRRLYFYRPVGDRNRYYFTEAVPTVKSCIKSCRLAIKQGDKTRAEEALTEVISKAEFYELENDKGIVREINSLKEDIERIQ